MAATEVVDPQVVKPGTAENIRAAIGVARYRAATVDHDARPLAYSYRQLKAGGAAEKWLKDEPRTWERFCLEALGYEAAFLDAVDEGVRVLESDGHWGAIPGVEAYETGERMLKAAHSTTQKVLGHGGDRRSAAISSGRRRLETQAVRAGRSGISPRSQQRLDRLAARFPELMERVRSGQLSATEADRIASGAPKRALVPLEAGALAETLRRCLASEEIDRLVRLLMEKR